MTHRDKRPVYKRRKMKFEEEKRDVLWQYNHAMDAINHIQEDDFDSSPLYTREECFTTLAKIAAQLKVIRMERALARTNEEDREHLIVTEIQQVDELARHLPACEEMNTAEAREHVHLLLVDTLDSFIYEIITASLEEKRSHQTTNEEKEITQ